MGSGAPGAALPVRLGTGWPGPGLEVPPPAEGVTGFAASALAAAPAPEAAWLHTIDSLAHEGRHESALLATQAAQAQGQSPALLLRLAPDLHAAVERTAAAELRSVNAQIELLIREGLARRGVKLADAAPVRRGRPQKDS